MVKVIFLDCDGVLNSRRYLNTLKCAAPMFSLDPKAVKLITDLMNEDPDIRIVLSSTWKRHKDALRILTNYGIVIYDLTPDLCGSGSRGEEIAKWVTQNEDIIQSFVIVDDNSDLLPQQRKRLVQTSFADGLQPKHIQVIQRILHCPLNQPVLRGD